MAGFGIKLGFLAVKKLFWVKGSLSSMWIPFLHRSSYKEKAKYTGKFIDKQYSLKSKKNSKELENQISISSKTNQTFLNRLHFPVKKTNDLVTMPAKSEKPKPVFG